MKEYLDKRARLDEKKIINKKNVQKIMETTVKEKMAKNNDKFMK